MKWGKPRNSFTQPESENSHGLNPARRKFHSVHNNILKNKKLKKIDYKIIFIKI